MIFWLHGNRCPLDRITELIYWSARLLVGALFLVSGVLKLISPQAAAAFLAKILQTDAGVSIVAIRLIALCEIALGYFVVTGKKEEYTSIITLLTFLVFSFAGIICGSPEQTCGCFGDLVESHVDEMLLLRNSLFMLFSMYLVWHSDRVTNRCEEQQ
jgi:uncharacterized membrane protein YphA (DoxX/SURF4 family)